MACHARRSLTVCTFQGRWWHCHNQRRQTVYIAQFPWCHATPDVVWSCFAIQGRWWHAMLDIVWSCFIIQGGWWHTTPDIVQSCVLSKGEDVIYTRCRATVCAKLGEIYNWMGQKAFYHKIDYITSKFTFLNVLQRYSELKNLLSFIRFVVINNYNYLKYYGKFKI